MSSQALEQSSAHPANPNFQHQYEDLQQQYSSTTFGMWVFLVQEILFFGSLFCAYAVYRSMYPEAYSAASHHLNVALGTFNTVVLIGSSLTMALAVRCAQLGRNKGVFGYLLATFMLGNVFLGVKVVEYSDKFKHHLVPGPNFAMGGPYNEQAQIYFSMYFAMTGLHALHMIIGAGLLIFFMWKAYNNTYSTDFYGPIENMGLYWHFVDIVWIFLFPMLYLIH
ncbi:MAG: cytochrome c oxidase subunit 3 family protein [Bryobacterales bacterium]|nr:cytochrome c oxidase subunit 3 family protein [Bryobacterales bacterium]